MYVNFKNEGKGVTSFRRHRRYAVLRRLERRWTRSYFAATAGNVSSKTVKRYIESQKGRSAMRKAFVYRIYPSKPQERRLEQVRETLRIVKRAGKWYAAFQIRLSGEARRGRKALRTWVLAAPVATA